ncbi:MAG: hypothetical protein B7Z66_11350 [Chromatiales bacterium 21-64-14]|nr:MAG: hypothetical protein B7Z66_11350 [Chromatiales bacterium 21-64-14]
MGLWTAGSARAATSPDVAHGKELHNASCLACHNPSVYTRPDHKIRSLTALHRQVAACQKAAGANWNAAGRNDVVEYLNQTFYHFAPGNGHE